MDIEKILSYLPAFLMAVISFLAYQNDRKKTGADVFTDTLDAYKKSIEMREHDIQYLKDKVAEIEDALIKHKLYVEYLLEWIGRNKRKKPINYDEFIGSR